MYDRSSSWAEAREDLRTKIMDFRGFDSSVKINSKGWNSQAHRECPGKFESSSLSRDNLNRGVGRTGGS